MNIVLTYNYEEHNSAVPRLVTKIKLYFPVGGLGITAETNAHRQYKPLQCYIEDRSIGLKCDINAFDASLLCYSSFSTACLMHLV